MSVYPRAGSPYYYTEFQIDGHRICRSTKATTRREALAAEKRIRAEETKRIQGGNREQITIDQAFARFWLEVGSTYDDTKQRKDTDRYIQQILNVVDP